MTDKTRLSGNWGDLGPRAATTLALLAVATAALWAGGAAWVFLIVAITTLVGWELVGLCQPGLRQARRLLLVLSLLLPLAIMAYPFLTGIRGETVRTFQYASWPVMLLPGMLGRAYLQRAWWIWAGYGLVLQFGAQYFLFTGLDPWGLKWLLSVATVVIITDVLGYVVGRLIGGAEFWPRFSPDLPRSGAVAGWIGAAVFGALVMRRPDLIGSPLLGAVTGVAIALSSQMGAIAVTAMKRQAHPKPGDGAGLGRSWFIDWFATMIAAAAAVIVWMLVF